MNSKVIDPTLNKLFLEESAIREADFPKVSIVIPTLNSASLVGTTLESILQQDYPDFEVLVIDSGSSDRTIQVVKSLKDHRIKIYAVSGYSRYAMLNKGITHAEGTYINFLFPGDFYIYKHSLREIMRLAIEKKLPALVYGGALIRDGRTEVKLLYREMTLDLLKSGRQPTSLQSCWFRDDVFAKIGKFNPDYEQRGGFDLLCRLMLEGKYSYASISRVLTDYDLRSVTREMVIRHFVETFKILFKYFGLGTTIAWIFKQKDSNRFIKLWFRSLKVAFLGKS